MKFESLFFGVNSQTSQLCLQNRVFDMNFISFFSFLSFKRKKIQKYHCHLYALRFKIVILSTDSDYSKILRLKEGKIL
jgi:hypothetical protein